MPRRLPPIAVLLFLFLALPAQAAKPAPNFTLPSVVGNGKISLSNYKGRVIYLDFWATWCPPCRKSFPWMDDMQAQYDDAGLTIIAVSIDRNRELAERFVQQMEPGFKVVHDPASAVSRKYGVSAMPTSYLIDRDGNIVSTHVGFRESDKAKLEQQIEDLLD